MLSNEVLTKLLCWPNLEQHLFFQSWQMGSFTARHCSYLIKPRLIWKAKLLKKVPLKLENQIKVTNRSSFNNPFGKRNVISFTMYYNLAPGNIKNCFFTKKPFYSMKSRFLHFLGLYCNTSQKWSHFFTQIGSWKKIY